MLPQPAQQTLHNPAQKLACQDALNIMDKRGIGETNERDFECRIGDEEDEHGKSFSRALKRKLTGGQYLVIYHVTST